MRDAVVYSRVSTNRQDFQRQLTELESVMKSKGFNMIRSYCEVISGTKKNDERKALKALLESFERNENQNKKTVVFVTEVSRLGRNSLEVLKTLELLSEKGISVYTNDFGLETLNPDGTRNPLAQFIFVLLAQLAEMELEFTRNRIKSGLANKKAKGELYHRPKGSVKTDETLLEDHKDIKKRLDKGLSIREVAKLTGKSTTTVQKVKRALKKKNEPA